MYLHKDREMFKDIIEQTAEQIGKVPVVIEKDYYVTLILKLLAEQLDQCVFKGGTSLSKGFRVINRFSEDIDITFKEHIGESRRKRIASEMEERGLNPALISDGQEFKPAGGAIFAQLWRVVRSTVTAVPAGSRP